MNPILILRKGWKWQPGAFLARTKADSLVFCEALRSNKMRPINSSFLTNPLRYFFADFQ